MKEGNIFDQVMYPHHSVSRILGNVVKTLIVSDVRARDQGTRSPIELFWTAKKEARNPRRYASLKIRPTNSPTDKGNV